jgi:8-oxo-dGTP pyrophosphatase MutT (NUDIX family)
MIERVHVDVAELALPPHHVKHNVFRAILANTCGQVVLLQRPSAKGYQPDHYEFPGGKMDRGETPAETIVREVWEETGLNVQPHIGPDDEIITAERLMRDVGRFIRTTTVRATILGGEYAYDSREHQRLLVIDPQVSAHFPLTDECRHAMEEFGLIPAPQQMPLAS